MLLLVVAIIVGEGVRSEIRSDAVIEYHEFNDPEVPE